MKIIDLCEYLGKIEYPGRGIVMGRSIDGAKAVIAYFIMGRSENSRNRVFTLKDGGIVTEPFDPALVTDPSLIIYAPVRILDDETTIVTNGDQTDTIIQYMQADKTFEAALRTRSFEPDAPNYTPRISGLMHVAGGEMDYKLSLIKSDAGNPDSVQRYFYEYPQPLAGEGRLLHTYREDGKPLPSFVGEPVHVCIHGQDIDQFATLLWNALDMQNKVSLFVRSVDLTNGHTDTRILGKH